MPVIAIIIPIAIDVAVTAGAEATIATIAAGTIFTTVTAAGVVGLSTVGFIAAGVVGGLASGIVGAELTGGDVGKGALFGALGGGLSGGLGSLAAPGASGSLFDPISGQSYTATTPSFTQGIVDSVHSATNLPNSVINTVLKAASGAGIGAGKALVSGTNVGQGALAGGISGLGSGLGGQFDYASIAKDTSLPPDVVQGVLNAAGKAGFGAGAAAATGQDVGLSALSGAAQGALPPLIQAAFNEAKDAYNAAFGPAQDAATQAAQDAYAQIVTPAQNQLNALEQQGQDYLDSYKAGLISQIQDAQTKYEAALAAVNQQPWAIRIVNGEPPPPTGPRGSGNLGAYEAAKPIADAYQQADQNLQAVTQQATTDWNSIQQMVQDQFTQATQPLVQTIQNAGSDPSVQQAYDTTLQQNLAPAQQKLAEAETAVQQATDAASGGATEGPAPSYQYFKTFDELNAAFPDKSFISNYNVITLQPGDPSGYPAGFYVLPQGGTLAGTGDVAPPVAGGGGAGGAPSPAQGTTTGPDVTSGATQSEISGAGTSSTDFRPLSPRDQQLINLSGLSQDTSPQQGVSTTNLDFGTFSAPVPSTHDQQIRTLAGLSTAPTTSQTAASSASGTGTTAGTGSGTGTSEGFGGTGTGAGGAGTGTGAGGQEGGTGGGGTGGTGSGGDGKTLDFGAGTIPLAQRRPAGQTTGPTTGPTTPDIPGPGSQALAQALAAPAIGYSPGGDIFGVLGKRTPVWNKSSLRAEDTSGVSG